jgi:hypothetical protein
VHTSFLFLPLLYHHRGSVAHVVMSGHQTKRTVAQLRAEKEQRERDFDEGNRLAHDVIDARGRVEEEERWP